MAGKLPLTDSKNKKTAPISRNKILWIFGGQVKEERKKNGVTQAELAAAAGVSADTIKRIESGKGVRLDVAYQIAVALRVPIQSLLPPQEVSEDELIRCIEAAQETLQLLLDKHKENYKR